MCKLARVPVLTCFFFGLLAGVALFAAEPTQQETHGPNSPVAYTSKGNITITINELKEIERVVKEAIASYENDPSDKERAILVSKLDKLFTDAIRYNLPPEQMEGSAAMFAAVKFFLDDIEERPHNVRWHYHRLVVSATRGLSTSIMPLLKARKFEDFLKSVGVKITVMTFAERKKRNAPWPNTGLVLAASNGPMFGAGSDSDLHYVLYPNLELWIDERVLRELEKVHFEFRRLYTEVVRDAVSASQSKGR
jgi:hypothetical protein